VAKRTVLRRFRSKEELFVAAMMERARGEMRRRDEAPAATSPARWRTWSRATSGSGRTGCGCSPRRTGSQSWPRTSRADAATTAGWVERTFAPLLDGLDGAARDRRVAALVALTDVHTWKLRRRDLNLEPEEVVRTLVEVIDALKGAP